VPTGPQVTYSFGSGITVTVANQTATLQTGLTSVTLNVTAQTSVAPGLYNLTVVNPDCTVVIFGNAIQVNASAAAAPAPAPKPLTPPKAATPQPTGAATPARPAAKTKSGTGSSTPTS